MTDVLKLFNRRQSRVRAKLKRTANNRPRLSIFHSNQHVYAQVIDDVRGITLASASTLDETVVKELQGLRKAGVEAAKVVGRYVAERALEANVKEVVFDRGGYLYHGKVKALADAARASGLKF